MWTSNQYTLKTYNMQILQLYVEDADNFQKAEFLLPLQMLGKVSLWSKEWYRDTEL